MGHALPFPVSTKEIQVGQCGYFDDTNTWNPIVQITDPKAVAEAQLLPMDNINFKTTRAEFSMGPIKSDMVHASDPKLDIGAAVPGIQVEGSIQFEISNDCSFGAVLTTEAPVIRESYPRQEEPWKRWIKANSKALMQNYRAEVDKYNLWIITQVHMTKTARISILNKSKRKVSIGFKAEVAQIGKIDPHGGWSSQNNNEDWQEYKAKDDEQIVVFITGFYFGFNIFTRSLSGRRLPQATQPPQNAPDFKSYDGKYELPLEKESLNGSEKVLEVNFVAIGSTDDSTPEDEDDEDKNE